MADPPLLPTAPAVAATLAKYLDVEASRVVPLAQLEDLGATPLALVQTMLALEDQFEIEVVISEIASFATVEDLMAHVAHARRLVRTKTTTTIGVGEERRP